MTVVSRPDLGELGVELQNELHKTLAKQRLVPYLLFVIESLRSGGSVQEIGCQVQKSSFEDIFFSAT